MQPLPLLDNPNGGIMKVISIREMSYLYYYISASSDSLICFEMMQ